MGYVFEGAEKDAAALRAENLALQKEIAVLKLANRQLTEEKDKYKGAYERYAHSFLIRIIKKVLRRND